MTSDTHALRCADCTRLDPEGERPRCLLRAIVISDPTTRWCADHSGLAPDADLPVGPVLKDIGSGPAIALESPDTRAIRSHLLDIAESCYGRDLTALTPRERAALWQLETWDEPRAAEAVGRIPEAPKLPGVRDGQELAATGRPVSPAAPPPPPTRRQLADYRDPGPLAEFATIAIVTSILGAIGLVLVADPFAQVDQDPILSPLLILAYVATQVMAWIAVIAWLRRVILNLSAFGRHPRYGPDWAIGAWFVPILNLFRPAEMVGDAYRTSHAAAGLSAGPPLVALWWGSWLTSRFVDRLSTKMLTGDLRVTAEATRTTSTVAIGLMALAGVVLIRLVRRTAAAQQTAFAVFSEPSAEGISGIPVPDR